MLKTAQRFHAQLKGSRIALFSMLPFAAIAVAGMMDVVQPVLKLVYIVAGFSLIIFLHELGHFAVARMCSVKCLAFSIGIGPRMLGWKKGVGLSFGNEPDVIDTTAKEVIESAVEGDIQQSAGVTFKEKTNRLGEVEKTLGDCDYRVSWLPLGGYVRMLGQDDMDPTKVSEDPHAFNQRPIWQRMCIVSAGVIMNLIFAAVCFSIIFSPGIGVDFPPAVIGSVVYDSPAWKAGFRPGDEVISINDQPYRGFLEFTDIQMESALAARGSTLNFKVRHPDGKEETLSASPTRMEGNGLQAIGVSPMPGLKIGLKGSDLVSPELDKLADPTYLKNKDALLKIEQDDKIVAVDGTPLQDQYLNLYNHVQSVNGAPVKLTLEHKNGTLNPNPITLYTRLEPIPGAPGFPKVLGLQPAVILGEPVKGSPADAAGLKENDRVLSVGERTNPTREEMIDIISSHPGSPVQITVQRAGQAAPIPVTVTPKNTKGKGLINVHLEQDVDHLTFIPPGPDSEIGALNLPATATIASVDGQTVSNWDEIYSLLRTKAPDSQIKLTFNTGSGTKDLTLAYAKADHDAVTERLHYLLGVPLAYRVKTQVADNAGQAILMGMDHTKKFILNVYMTLAGLARGTVDPSNLHGIVGITKVGYDVQERGTVWLWYVLAMVSVNLAVANFLPLPIVDGGLFLLLILEKIRGKPLSLKVQSAIQTVGIVLLAGLFLFVTYNDITGLILKN